MMSLEEEIKTMNDPSYDSYEDDVTESDVTENVELQEPKVEDDEPEIKELEEPKVDDSEAQQKLAKALEEMEGMRKRIEEIEGQRDDKVDSVETDEKEDVDTQVFIKDDDDFDDLLRDREKFNTLLNDVYRKGAKDIREKVIESVLRSVPEIVRVNVETSLALKTQADEFYKDNPDLVKYKKDVASVFEEMASKSPEVSMEKLLDDVESEVRKKLNLKKDTIKPNRPSFAPATRTRTGKNQKSDLAPILGEIDQMNSLLE